MTSLMRSLLSVRTSADSRNDARSETPRSPFGSLPSSPSFNDFSFFSAQDAEFTFADDEQAASKAVDLSQSYVSRSSIESRSSIDAGSLKGGWDPAGTVHLKRVSSLLPKTAAIAIPNSQQKAKAEVASESVPVNKPRVRRKPGKIDGMDYYEFCELIRSSSL